MKEYEKIKKIDDAMSALIEITSIGDIKGIDSEQIQNILLALNNERRYVKTEILRKISRGEEIF